jgi:hypothetical protein
VQLGEPRRDVVERNVHGSWKMRPRVHGCVASIDQSHLSALKQNRDLFRAEGASGTWQERLEHLLQVVPLERADLSTDRTTLMEHDEGRDGLHAHLSRQHRRAIDVDCDDLRLAFQLLLERLQLWSDDLAGAAPLRAELEQHGQLAQHDFALERLFVDGLKGHRSAALIRPGTRREKPSPQTRLGPPRRAEMWSSRTSAST